MPPPEQFSSGPSCRVLQASNWHLIERKHCKGSKPLLSSSLTYSHMARKDRCCGPAWCPSASARRRPTGNARPAGRPASSSAAPPPPGHKQAYSWNYIYAATGGAYVDEGEVDGGRFVVVSWRGAAVAAARVVRGDGEEPAVAEELEGVGGVGEAPSDGGNGGDGGRVELQKSHCSLPPEAPPCSLFSWLLIRSALLSAQCVDSVYLIPPAYVWRFGLKISFFFLPLVII